MNFEIRPGDYFCVQTSGIISRMILWFQKLKALDHESTYNHAGIIVNSDGTTFESLAKIAHYGLQGYVGHKVIIGRHCKMNVPTFLRGYHVIKKFDGYRYPAWRLLWHAFGLANVIDVIRVPVCSELVIEHARAAGLVEYDGYGWSPDNLADEMRRSKYFDIVYEGVL